MEKTVGFAVIGCGSIAQIAHFPSIKRTPGAVLVACCDIDAGDGRARGPRVGRDCLVHRLSRDVCQAGATWMR